MKGFAFTVVCALVLTCCGRQQSSSTPENKDEARKTSKSQQEKEESKGAAETVAISAEAQQLNGIVVTPAATTPMTQQLQTVGTVQPVDSSIAHVRPIARGRLLEVLVKAGDRVTAGQVLAQLDNIEAGEVAAQYNSAKAELERLKIQLAAQQHQAERDRRLVEIGAVPQKEYDFSLAQQQALEESVRAQESTISGLNARLRRFGISGSENDSTSATAIRAPFPGVILSVTAAPGDVVEAGTELFALSNLSTVYVQAQVYEKDLGQVHVGQAASITVDSYPGEHFSGRVVSINDVIDPQTRTAAVRCQVSNPHDRLKLNMLATVQFPTTISRAAVTVPDDAVQTIAEKTVVFVRTSSSSFSTRQVRTGVTNEGRTEIFEGLRVGEPVVTKGAFAVKSVLLGKELQEEKE